MLHQSGRGIPAGPLLVEDSPIATHLTTIYGLMCNLQCLGATIASSCRCVERKTLPLIPPPAPSPAHPRPDLVLRGLYCQLQLLQLPQPTGDGGVAHRRTARSVEASLLGGPGCGGSGPMVRGACICCRPQRKLVLVRGRHARARGAQSSSPMALGRCVGHHRTGRPPCMLIRRTPSLLPPWHSQTLNPPALVPAFTHVLAPRRPGCSCFLLLCRSSVPPPAS